MQLVSGSLALHGLSCWGRVEQPCGSVQELLPEACNFIFMRLQQFPGCFQA